jgi:hypothetical protein
MAAGSGMNGSASAAQIGGGVQVGYPLTVGTALVPFGGGAWKASRTASGSLRTGCSASEVAVEEMASVRPVIPIGSSPSKE